MDLKELQTLKEKTLKCRQCGLRRQAKQVVFDDGNPGYGLMFVGEGPGAHEDEMGIPFVGAAGQLLNRILEAAGFKRENVYITNVVKCRPPGNRLPTAEEVKACRPILEAQIDIIRPQIIVCLGALATRTLIAAEARITRIRGQWIEKGGIRYLPTYHPAALLRDPSKKRPVWEDFKKLRDYYQEIHTWQLTLF